VTIFIIRSGRKETFTRPPSLVAGCWQFSAQHSFAVAILEDSPDWDAANLQHEDTLQVPEPDGALTEAMAPLA
jgi:hypothetical protein